MGKKTKPLRSKNWQLVLCTFVFPFDPSIPKKGIDHKGSSGNILRERKGKEAKKTKKGRFLLSVGSTNRDTCNLQKMVVESWNNQPVASVVRAW